VTEPILTTTQIAERAHCSRVWLWKLARKDLIPAERANPNGTHYRFFDSPELRAWCAKEARKPRRGPAPKESQEDRQQRRRPWSWTKDHEALLKRKRPRLDSIAQDMWRKLCVKKRLSVRELQESIRKGSVTRNKIDPDRDRGYGFASFESLYVQWKLLRKQIEEVWRTWSDENIKEALDFMAPVESFARELRNVQLRRSEGDQLP
jgi:hypothetical protein